MTDKELTAVLQREKDAAIERVMADLAKIFSPC